jgi:pyruvate kinase
VLDGTDCVMLLKETQDGMYPLNAVSHLGKIMTETEQCIDYRALYEDIKGLTPRRIGQLETMASSAVATSLSL